MLGHRPRIIISALKGGAGKTILSLGITAAWKQRRRKVAVFKKGPDFIDSGWLSFAAGRPCYNLDPFLMSRQEIARSFLLHSADADISVIEGNRGLFDGLDLDGCCSTAELGRMINCPVILIADVTMATRTVAALILGCQRFDPELRIAAVILNRVAGSRQESIVRNAIEQYCGIPVAGAVPKLKGDIFPERHMGLVPHLESAYAEKAIEWAMGVVEENLDLQMLWGLACDAVPLAGEKSFLEDGPSSSARTVPPRVGVIRDSSFWFYYPENLRQLENLGATLVEINSIKDDHLPDLDALYIGGGFPEVQAEALADNKGFKESLKRGIEEGMPVYAECGGLMYLGENLVVEGVTYPMVGSLPVTFILERKPQGHGYTILEVARENPYYPMGEIIKGHEFHYSRALIRDSEEVCAVFKVLRGRGLDGQTDGLCRKNLLATYTHVHAAGNPLWGKSLFRAALDSQGLKMKHFSDDRKKGD
jgi:cobyrinic acid a,c-diamide synthase